MAFIRSCIVLFLCFTFYNVNAQELRLVFKDKVTDQSIEFAHVTARSLTGKSEENAISNVDGIAVINQKTPLIIAVSSLGFKTYIDTINTSGEHTILLSPEYYQLDRVVVTGQFRAQPVDKSIYKIDVLDNKQIQLKSANNLGDLLQNELSFQYRSEGVLGDFLRIQGLSGEHVKILMDGMPVAGRSAGKIDLGQLSLYNVDHVEVIEGPVSVIYGSNALAGAINIITSDYSKKDYTGNLKMYYESVGAYNFDLTASKRFGKHTFALHGARYFHSGWGPEDISRYKIWKPKLQYFTGGSYAFRKKTFHINYITDYLHEELRDPGPLTSENLFETALDGYHYTSRWNNSLGIGNTFNDDFILNLQAGYSYYKKRKITYVNDLVNLEKTLAENEDLHDTTQFHEVTSRLFVSNISGNKLEYQTGFDFNNEFAKGNRVRGKQNITDLAGFISIIYRPAETFSLQPGLRLIYNSRFKAPVVYAINFKYQPDHFVIRGSFARGFSSPSIKQLYLEFIDNNHEILGNEDLKSEDGHNLRLSAEYSRSINKNNFEFSLDLFYNAIQNSIQLAIDTSVPGLGRGKYFNLEGTTFKTQGFESAIRYHLFPRLTLGLGIVTTGRSKVDEQGFFYSTDLTSTLQYFSPKYEYELGIFYKYNDDYLEFAGNFNQDGELNGVAQRSISGYHIMNITLSKFFWKQRLTVSAGIKNLFNVTLVDSSGKLFFHDSGTTSTAIGYGRTFFISLNFNFEKL